MISPMNYNTSQILGLWSRPGIRLLKPDLGLEIGTELSLEILDTGKVARSGSATLISYYKLHLTQVELRRLMKDVEDMQLERSEQDQVRSSCNIFPLLIYSATH